MSESSLVQSAARVLNKETYNYPFNSLALSSTNTLVIQKNLMATHVLAVIEFKPPPAAKSGYYLDQGWGWKAMRRIQWQYGGSEILEVDVHDNFMRSICEAEGDRKKAAMIQLGGNFCTVNADGSLVGESPSSDGSGTLVFKAVVPIILPHSSISSLRQLPFDVSCLNQSVNIRLTLEDASALWQWGGITGDIVQPTLDTSQQNLSYGQFIVGQQILIDTIASKKDLVSGMGPNSNYQLNYYFKYPQHYETTFTSSGPDPGGLIRDSANTGKLTTKGGAINVVLNSFRNAALDSLVFWVERTGGFAQRSAAQAAAFPMSTGLNIIPMSNITITYAGTQIYKSTSNELSQALDYMINETDSTYSYMSGTRSGPAVPAGTAPVVVGAVSANGGRQIYVRVQIAQFSETLFGGSAAGSMIQAAGGLLSNDTLQMSFDITDSFAVATGTPATFNAIPYRLNMEMLYQSSVVIERGTARFGFVNPMGQPQINFSNM